jgi:CO/xanthine dehydrogenase FAD-binding subunit
MDLSTITEIARPDSLSALAPWRDGDAYLAGGTWLFSEPQPALTRLIDISEFRWPAIEATPGGLRIAATCTLAQLAAADFTWTAAPLFRQCCRALLGSFKIWNVATVGGNLCMALPAGPMAALVTALEGTCTTWRPERTIKAIDFVTGPNRNALKPGELLRAVDLPLAALQRRTAFRQISLTPAGRSAALLVGTLGSGFSLTVTAATRRPVRLDFPAVPSDPELADALAAAIPDTLYFDDIHGDPAWRRHMTFRLAREIRQELA